MSTLFSKPDSYPVEGKYTLDRETIGTRYVFAALRDLQRVSVG